MKKTIIFLWVIIYSTVSFAGGISDTFNEGVYDTKWGEKFSKIKELYPESKVDRLKNISQLTIEDGREVLGVSRDSDSKISFIFDADDRLNGVSVYFDGEDYYSLISKLTTLFGQYKTQSANYVQWEQDGDVIITASINVSGFSSEAIFSIGYYKLPTVKISKKGLGF